MYNRKLKDEIQQHINFTTKKLLNEWHEDFLSLFKKNFAPSVSREWEN